MHTIIEKDGKWTVCYPIGNRWERVADFIDMVDACRWCSWLNGGLDPKLTLKLLDMEGRG